MLWRRACLVLAVALLAACSSNHEANPNEAGPPVDVTATSVGTTVSGASTDSSDPSSSGPTTSSGSSTPTSSGGPTTSAGPLTVTGRAIAGVAGGVETAEPFAATDPFSEAVRLADGTCVGWAGSQGGSTAGLAVGAPVTVLGVEDNTELGSGSITSSRWEDMAGGAEQFNCSFDFTVTLDAPHAEFRIKVGALAPWLARPDSTLPGTYTASVSTGASIALIPECPAVPAQPDPTATTAAPTTTLVAPPTTAAPVPVTGWNAVGQYWSTGVRSLCTAGLPVVAIARPCRPPGAGSEYITQIVNNEDPTEVYANGAAIPSGTQLIAVVATGHPCD